MLVIAAPHPTNWASLAVECRAHKDDIYSAGLGPPIRMQGSRVAFERSLAWGEARL